MEKIVHALVQGSPEWAAFRLEHDGASEAAAMLGLSKTVSRTDLLRAKKIGLAKEFSAWVQANVLDHGHDVEAKARPIIEEIIGETLYPGTYSKGRRSASTDGATMSDEIVMEHKQYNAALFASVKDGVLPEEYMPQCQQVLQVVEAEKLIFVVSDGTRENIAYMWVKPDPAWFKRLDAGWAQFHEDLATYQHVEPAPVVVAAVQPSLPSPVVRVDGALVVASNLPEFAVALRSYIANIPTAPATDQEFADCEAACKNLKKAEEALQQAEDHALAQLTDIEQMRRLKNELHKLANTTRLAAEKMVTARKEQIRVEIYQTGIKAYQEHIARLNERIGRPYMPPLPVDFAGAIKGKRTVESLNNAVATHLATAKIAANEVADRIQINMASLRELASNHVSLFPDTAQIVLKASDDLVALVKNRIAEHERAEAERVELQRASIAREEAAKAEAKVRAEKDSEDALIDGIWKQARRIEGDRVGYVEKAIAYFEQGPGEFANDPRPRVAAAVVEARAEMKAKLDAAVLREQQEDRDRAARAAQQAILDAAKPATPAVPIVQSAPPTVVVGGRQVAASVGAPDMQPGPPTLTLGEMSSRLGFTVSAALLQTLGFEPVAKVKASVLFHEHQFHRICRALIKHIETVGELATA